MFANNDDSESKQFGTFTGVFLPTLLTILGAVMYLRTGWVVGNAGLGGAILIMLLANVITICTGLSIASMATNIRVRSGGAFSILAQSLGLEVSGSISIPFYIAQAIAVAFYILAFSEGWLRIFPDHPDFIVVLAVFVSTITIAAISAKLASRVHFIILFVHIAALTSVFLGTFGVANSEGITATPELWGQFSAASFWGVFAVFFPGVTGILAGVNLSGNLRNPRRSIPIGAISAILLTLTLYILLAFWFANVATSDELVNNLTVMVDKSAFGPAVLAGLLAATFSAAFTSLVGGPRILQAIAEQDMIPRSTSIARVTGSGEPRQALIITGTITFITLIAGLLSGGLNAIAPLMTMFYLITYASLNGVVLLEQTMGLVSFRPSFQVPWFVPLAGLLGCLIVMFLIEPVFSVFAIIMIVLLFGYLSRRDLTNPWGDVRSGLFVAMAEWAAKRVILMPGSSERAWKPNLLIPVTDTESLLGSYRFIRAVTYPRGSVSVLGLHATGKQEDVSGISEIVDEFLRDGIFAQSALLEGDDPDQGLLFGLDTLNTAFFRPNAIFLTPDRHMDGEILQTKLERAQKNETGAILFAQHPTTGLGREKSINVWIRDQSPEWEVGLRLSRLDLSLLLAFQIARNWNGHINLITVIAEKEEEKNGHVFLNSLITLGRMPRGTRAIVHVGEFDEFLQDAPSADLHIFGTGRHISLDFVWRMVDQNRASCIFVQDSGVESALA
jgi:amino acid transporter